MRRSDSKIGRSAPAAAAFLFCALLSGAFAGGMPAQIRFALSVDAVPPVNEQVIEPMIAALRARFGDSLVVRSYPLDRLEKALAAGEVDAFLSSSGLSRRMMHYGAKDLVTLSSKRFPNPNESFGGVFVVRRGSGINTFEDMKGRAAQVYIRNGFFSDHANRGEILRHGEDPNRFFSEVSYASGSMKEIVENLLAGRVDVGLLCTCFLEDVYGRGSAVYASLQGVALRAEEPCMRSSVQYPNWTVSTTPETRPEVSKAISQALLDMTPTRDGMQWTIGTDFSRTDALFRDLKTGPYDFLQHWDLMEFLRQYWQWLAAALIALCSLAAYAWQVRSLQRRTFEELEAALKAQKQLFAEKESAVEEMNELQKLSALNEIAAFVTHELGSRLAAIKLFAAGIHVNAERAGWKREVKAAGKIVEQVDRINEIIETIRGLVKRTRGEAVVIDLRGLLSDAASLFAMSRPGAEGLVSVDCPGDAPLRVRCRAEEMKLAVSNLLRNASEAYAEAGTPPAERRITVQCVELSSGLVRMEVDDQAVEMTDARLEALSSGLRANGQEYWYLKFTSTSPEHTRRT